MFTSSNLALFHTESAPLSQCCLPFWTSPSITLHQCILFYTTILSVSNSTLHTTPGNGAHVYKFTTATQYYIYPPHIVHTFSYWFRFKFLLHYTLYHSKLSLLLAHLPTTLDHNFLPFLSSIPLSCHFLVSFIDWLCCRPSTLPYISIFISHLFQPFSNPGYLLLQLQKLVHLQGFI